VLPDRAKSSLSRSDTFLGSKKVNEINDIIRKCAKWRYLFWGYFGYRKLWISERANMAGRGFQGRFTCLKDAH
jgi:hypothetical protein